MKTENELIAEFMGWKYAASKWFDPKGVGHKELRFHFSWNWLMPVVAEIEELYKQAFPPGPEFVRRILAKEEILDGPYMEVVATPLGTPIKEVYDKIVTFIKWYNSQKS